MLLSTSVSACLRAVPLAAIGSTAGLPTLEEPELEAVDGSGFVLSRNRWPRCSRERLQGGADSLGRSLWDINKLN